MSAENGKMHTTKTPTPNSTQTTTSMAAAKIKRELNSNSSILTNLGNATALPKLSSLTPARDLTLGGRGRVAPGSASGETAKKVFVPNLNAVRNKNTNVKTSKDTTTRGRGRGKAERGGRGGGGRGGANSSLIQTSGVFSEGAGAVNIRKSLSTNSSYGRSTDDAPSVMRKPTFIKSEQKPIDIKAEAAHVRELLGDSDEDDFIDEKTDLEHIPIKLSEAKWKHFKNEIKVEPKDINGVAHANNSVDDKDFTVPNAQTMHVEHQQTLDRTRYPLSVEQLLNSTQPQIFVMQMPDALPCEEYDDGDSSKPSAAKEGANSDEAVNQTPAQKPTRRSLKQLEEGQVGKLIRYKSGKVKLQLGDTYFDLDMGMETGFLQDLMSISTNREERSGNMINLGPIQAKLTATPDWEYLLNRQMSEDNV